MSLETLKATYPDYLIMQYRQRARARATIASLVQELWLDGMTIDEATCFNLDVAIGAQLDVIGRIVGVTRNIYGLDLEHEFFSMTDYADAVAVDMQRYTDSPFGPEIMNRYRLAATYIMTDFEFRYLIKLKIIYNMTARTARALIQAFWDIFGASVEVVDNKDMTMDINVSQPYQRVFLVADYIGVIPSPMGVAVTVNNV